MDLIHLHNALNDLIVYFEAINLHSTPSYRTELFIIYYWWVFEFFNSAEKLRPCLPRINHRVLNNILYKNIIFYIHYACKHPPYSKKINF